MKKRSLCFLCAIMLVLTFSGCGKVKGAARSIDTSSLYSRHEIEQAMDAVTRCFRSDYDNCTLLELRYEEDWNLQHAEMEAAQRDAAQAIIIRGSFRTGDTNNAFNPNFTYENYSWILTRSGIGGWTVSDGGYA